MPEPRSVLVIDDEAMIRLTLAAYLEDSGYCVFEAADGVEGIEFFLRHHPDIVLTDLRMPRLDGLGVINTIRELNPTVPIIVITGTGNDVAQKNSIALGACECLLKPFNDLSILEDAIVRALEPRKERGE